MKECNICGAVYSEEDGGCPVCSGSVAVIPEGPTESPGKARSFVKALLHTLLFRVIMYALMFVSIIVMALIGGGMPDYVSTDTGNVITVISYLVFLAVISLIIAARGKNFLVETGLKRCSAAVAAVSALFGWTANYVYTLIVSLIPWPQSVLTAHNEAYGSLTESGNDIFLLILTVSVLTGIVEEIVFRGLVLRALTPAFSPVLSALISALIFGLSHPSLIAVFYSALLGFVLGMLAHKYGSVLPCIAMHIAYNLAACVGYSEDGGVSFTVLLISIALHVITFGTLFRNKKALAVIKNEEIN